MPTARRHPIVVILVIALLGIAPAGAAGVATDQWLTPSDGATSDRFGSSIAASGDTIVVGAPRADAVYTDAGAAYVFVRSASGWVQQARLTAPDGAPSDRFGTSVSISGDTIAVGSPWDDDAASASGAVYVFERTGGEWAFRAKLVASDAERSDRFGSAVAVDGTAVLVGSPLSDDDGSGSGSAYVFVRTGSAWQQAAKLRAADAAGGDQFGTSVALSGGNAVVGSPFDDDAGNLTGSAYVFTEAGAWSQVAKLRADDRQAGDLFGLSVAVSSGTVIVGSPLDDDGGTQSGAAYVFSQAAAWNQVAKLVAAEPAGGDQFGTAVGIARASAVVGSPYDDGVGSVSLFSSGGGGWTATDRRASTGAGDTLGMVVAASVDVVAAGAPGAAPAGFDSGSAYVFSSSTNSAPECSAAAADSESLWAPDHRLVAIHVGGVTDADGDDVTITVDSIFSDEAVDARGSGATGPDAFGVGGAVAVLRAERSAHENGRVYHIGFSASDGNGGSCWGEVLVGVPLKARETAIDDGPLYDATIQP